MGAKPSFCMKFIATYLIKGIINPLDTNPKNWLLFYSNYNNHNHHHNHYNYNHHHNNRKM